jgi:hypothetical protein
VLALLYFCAMGIAGRAMHGRWILSDALVTAGGIAAILARWSPRPDATRQEVDVPLRR